MEKLGKVLFVMALVAYPVLLHTFVLKEQVEVWQLLIVMAPMLIVGSGMLFRMVRRIWWPLLMLLILALVYFIVSGDHGRIGLQVVNGVSHATINFFLFWLFGRTLLPGREPLIAQISRRVHGHLNPDIVAYARHVTIAWSIFPLAQILISLVLYIFAPLAVWSLFINVLNMPLLAAMFIGEKLYRVARFPDHPRTTITNVIKVYTRDFASPHKAINKQ